MTSQTLNSGGRSPAGRTSGPRSVWPWRAGSPGSPENAERTHRPAGGGGTKSKRSDPLELRDLLGMLTASPQVWRFAALCSQQQGFAFRYLQMRPGGLQRRLVLLRVKLRVLAGREGPEDIYGNLEKKEKQLELHITCNNSSELSRFPFSGNEPSCCRYALALLAASLLIQPERFRRPLRARARTASPAAAEISLISPCT